MVTPSDYHTIFLYFRREILAASGDVVTTRYDFWSLCAGKHVSNEVK